MTESGVQDASVGEDDFHAACGEDVVTVAGVSESAVCGVADEA